MQCFPEIYSIFCQQLADVWEQKLGEEQEKTGPLEHVCAALREDLDTQHKKRMEALEIKMKPIIIKDGPSKKVKKNFESWMYQRYSPTCFNLK
jgi:hypothetical protein